MFLQTTSHSEEIRQYLRDLAHIPALSSGEMQQLIERIANAPTAAHHARMRLAEAHLDLVLQLVQPYQPFGVPLSDLIEEGNLILTEAAHVFNPHGPLSFQAFVRVQVCQHLADMVKQQVRTCYPEPLASEILRRVMDVSLSHNGSGTYDERRHQNIQSHSQSLMTITRANQLAHLDNWQPVLRFLQATGLRRSELKSLTVGDLKAFDPEMGGLVIKAQGKGGRTRTVPVLPGREQDVLPLLTNRTHTELVFPCIPQHLDILRFRREYAQALYLTLAPTFRLPPADGRLPKHSYNRKAVRIVTHALGHHRIEIVLTHYLRLKLD